MSIDKAAVVVSHHQEPEELLSQWCHCCLAAGNEQFQKQRQVSVEEQQRMLNDLVEGQERALRAFIESQEQVRNAFIAEQQHQREEDVILYNGISSKTQAKILEKLCTVASKEVAMRIIATELAAMPPLVIGDQVSLTKPPTATMSSPQSTDISHNICDAQGPLPSQEDDDDDDDVIIISSRSIYRPDEDVTKGTAHKRPIAEFAEESKYNVVGSSTRPRIELRPANRPEQPQTISMGLVEGTDHIFRLAEHIDKWFVIICGCRNYVYHPFKDPKGIRYHLNRGIHSMPKNLTDEQIMRRFGYEVVGDDVNELWVEASNERLQRDYERMKQDKKKRKGRQGATPASRRVGRPPAASTAPPRTGSQMPEADMSLDASESQLFASESLPFPGPAEFPDGLPVFEDTSHDSMMFHTF